MKTFAISLFTAAALLSANAAYSASCEEAKETMPQLTVKQKFGANEYFRNERRHHQSRGSNSYRSEKEIQLLFRKIMHIESIAESCNIALRDISPKKYFELTGVEF